MVSLGSSLLRDPCWCWPALCTGRGCRGSRVGGEQRRGEPVSCWRLPTLYAEEVGAAGIGPEEGGASVPLASARFMC